MSTSSVDSEGLATESDRESATNRSGVLELGLGKSQTEFQNLVKKYVFHDTLVPLRWHYLRSRRRPSHKSHRYGEVVGKWTS